MRSETKSVIAPLVNAIKTAETAIVGFVHRRAEARRRRIAIEENFYRDLRKYYRDNNMPHVPIMWDDDWRMQR